MRSNTQLFCSKRTVKSFPSLFLLLLAFLFTGCDSFLEVSPSSSLILRENVFADDQTASSAAAGLYNTMLNLNLGMCNGGSSVYGGLLADEFYNTATSSTYDPFSQNNLQAGNSIANNNFWRRAYMTLYQANAVVEGLGNTTAVTKATRDQVLGEALFIRAFHLFLLVNFFGDVPLSLSTDFTVNEKMARTPASVVYDQILSDLQQAKSLLPEAYPSASRVRPNRFAVSALLARVYLYREKWENAEQEATSVISSGLYSLEPDPAAVFINSSNETIWQLMRETANTAEAALFIPASASARPTFSLYPKLAGSFEAGDKRKDAWIASRTVSAQAYYYPVKYKVRSSSTVTEYLVALRLAEQYLIRAEARAHQDNPAGAVADINEVRKRARQEPTALVPFPLPDIASSLSKEEILACLVKERYTELFAEWGHRWFDLKRWKLLDSEMQPLKNNWEPFKALLPVPFSELQLNINLSQNPGYDD